MVFACGLAAVAWIIARREFRLERAAWPLGVFFGVGVITSAAGWLSLGGPLLASQLFRITAWLLVAVAALCSRDTVRQLHGMLVGTASALLLVYAIGLVEIVTGFKVALWLIPSNSTADRLASDRWLAQAIFVNYNDYAIALAALCVLVGARLLFDAGRKPLVQAARAFILVTAAFMAIYTMSRAALLSMAAGAALLLLLAMRVTRSKPIHWAWGVAAAVLGSAGMFAVWRTSWVQDGSTSGRRQIIQYGIDLFQMHPMRLLTGFGSQDAYVALATQTYGERLFDPHNLLLELPIAFGIFGMAAYLVCWGQVLWQGIIRQNVVRYSLAYQMIVWAALTPLFGIASSAFLPYGYAWIGLIGAYGWFMVTRSRPDLPRRTPGRLDSVA